MKPMVEAVLNKLEYQCANIWEEKQPPPWLVPLLRDRHLQPIEKYSWRLYLRQATLPGICTVLLMVLTQMLLFAYLWYHDPLLFLNRTHHHKAFIGFLSHEGTYWLPYMLLGLLVFNYMLYLPRRYFWNRRASRLQSELLEHPLPSVVETASDTNIWPPAPHRPEVK